MLDYQQLVISEREELKIKLDALRLFIGSETFNALPEAERYRLFRQRVIMEDYVQVLDERINAFQATSEPQGDTQ